MEGRGRGVAVKGCDGRGDGGGVRAVVGGDNGRA